MHLDGHHMATVDHGGRSFGLAGFPVAACADALTRGDAVERSGRDMRWNGQGAKPETDGTIERLATDENHGDSDHAFGWSNLKEVALFHSGSGRPIVAEVSP